VFCTMLISWATFIFGPQVQIGGIQPTVTVPGGDVYPTYGTGAEKRGLDVYRANNFAACHTPMVRPAGFGPDLIRRWGILQRYSVAQDYMYDYPVMLGMQRVGPDLANVGARLDQQTILLHLYNPRDPRLRVTGTIMPPYPYLFKKQRIDRTPSPDALP